MMEDDQLITEIEDLAWHLSTDFDPETVWIKTFDVDPDVFKSYLKKIVADFPTWRFYVEAKNTQFTQYGTGRKATITQTTLFVVPQALSVEAK